MPTILTAEDVVKRIVAECAYIDDRGVVGIRLKPAATITSVYRKSKAAEGITAAQALLRF